MKNIKNFSILPFIIILLFASSCEKDDDTTVDSDGYNSENNTLTDSRDGKVYKTVTIGDQVWMAENLAYLPSVNQDADGSEDVYGAGSYYYVYGYDGTNVTDAKATSNYTTYGVLYNWYAAMDGSASSSANPSGVQGVCPTGWHLPSDAEWKELEMVLGMSQVDADNTGYRGTNEGSKLAGNEGLWGDGALKNDGDFGTSGFTALPGGYRAGGRFFSVEEFGYWWSSTGHSNLGAWSRALIWATSDVGRDDEIKHNGYSVRCLRD